MRESSNIRIVLVRPKESGNVGAAARAMKNMGLHDLVLVAPRTEDDAMGRRMAVHAIDVLESARVVDGLEEAVDDCARVFGTTAKPGPLRRHPRSLREAAPDAIATAGSSRIAIVFGPEDTGLSNDDSKLCDEWIRIPTHAGYASLNLAQAVLLVAWELFGASGEGGSRSGPALAPRALVDRAMAKLRRALLDCGYLAEEGSDPVMVGIRRLLVRARPETREARILLGLASHLSWFARGGYRTIEAKRERGERLK